MANDNKWIQKIGELVSEGVSMARNTMKKMEKKTAKKAAKKAPKKTNKKVAKKVTKVERSAKKAVKAKPLKKAPVPKKPERHEVKKESDLKKATKKKVQGHGHASAPVKAAPVRTPLKKVETKPVRKGLLKKESEKKVSAKRFHVEEGDGAALAHPAEKSKKLRKGPAEDPGHSREEGGSEGEKDFKEVHKKKGNKQEPADEEGAYAEGDGSDMDDSGSIKDLDDSFELEEDEGALGDPDNEEVDIEHEMLLRAKELGEKIVEEVVALSEDYNMADIREAIRGIDFFNNSDTDECAEKYCENLQTTLGFCRFHYIKNWKTIRKKRTILAEGKLQQFIEELIHKYPPKYIEIIMNDLSGDKQFYRILKDLNIDTIFQFDESSSDLDPDDDITVETRGFTGTRANFDEEDIL